MAVAIRQMTYAQAINEAMRLEMRRDPRVILMGEDGAGGHYSVFTHMPGIKTVVPSTPADAKGLLAAAIRDEDLVICFENKMLYAMSGEVPEGEYVIPLGKADIKREGTDVTIVAISRMVHQALTAADALQAEGISAESVDPRTLSP